MLNVDRISNKSPVEVESLLHEDNLRETRKLVLIVAAVTTVLAISLLLLQVNQFAAYALGGGLPITAAAGAIDLTMLIIVCVTSVKIKALERANNLKGTQALIDRRERERAQEEAELASPPLSAAPLSPLAQPALPNPAAISSPVPRPSEAVAVVGAAPSLPAARALSAPVAQADEFPLRPNPFQFYQKYLHPLLTLYDKLFESLLRTEHSADERSSDELDVQLNDFDAGCKSAKETARRFLGVDINRHTWDPKILVGNFVSAHFAAPFPQGVGIRFPELALYQWVKASSFGKGGNFKKEFENSVAFNEMADLRQLFRGPHEINEAFLNRILEGVEKILPLTGDEKSRALVLKTIGHLRAAAAQLVTNHPIQQTFQRLTDLANDPRQFQITLSSLLSQLVNALPENNSAEELAEDIIQSIIQMDSVHNLLGNAAPQALPEMLERVSDSLKKVRENLGQLSLLFPQLDQMMLDIELESLGVDPKDPIASAWAKQVFEREAAKNLGRYQFDNRTHLLPKGQGSEKMGENEYRALIGRGPAVGPTWIVDPFAKEYADQYEKYYGREALEKRIKKYGEEIQKVQVGNEQRFAITLPKTLPRVSLLLLDAGLGGPEMTLEQYRVFADKDPLAKACFDHFRKTHGDDAAEELIKEFGTTVETIEVGGQTRYGIYLPSSRFNWVVLKKNKALMKMAELAGSVFTTSYMKKNADWLLMNEMFQWLNTFPLLTPFVDPYMPAQEPGKFKKSLARNFWDALAPAMIAGTSKSYFKETYKTLFFDNFQKMVGTFKALVIEKGKELTLRDILPVVQKEVNRSTWVLQLVNRMFSWSKPNKFPKLSPYLGPVMRRMWDGLALPVVANIEKLDALSKAPFLDQLQQSFVLLEAAAAKDKGDKFTEEDHIPVSLLPIIERELQRLKE